jgi:hypothetical protein
VPARVGQAHPQDAAHPRLQVLRGQAGLREPGGGELLAERVDDGGDRDSDRVQALALDQFLGVPDGMIGGVPAGQQHHMHVVRPDRIGGDRGRQRRVDAAGQAHDDGAEAVLVRVVPYAGDQRRVHLGGVGQPRPEQVRLGQLVRRGDFDRRGQCHPPDRDHRAVFGVDGFVRGNRGALSGREVEVGDHQRFLELRPAGQQLPVGPDQDRVAVEDQLVLTADQVSVGEGRAGLAGPPGAQLQPDVVLAALVRGCVRHD